MQKRSLRRLWKQIILFLSKLASFLRGNRRRLKRRRHLLLRDEVAQTRLDRHIQSQVEQPVLGNIENDEASVTSLEPPIQSQVEQTISGNENVLQNVKGNNNINVGRVEGSLTINYRRPIDRPFQVQSLPANFVDRPQVTIEIKARLLANTSNAGALLISAIHGLGGIGKTTLVTALAHDEDIQKRFSGGVLWATLGQEPDILAWLSSWVQALGDNEFRAINIEATSAHLRSLLHDKAVLLVVDDAWKPDKVKPFLIASSQSQLLITSRRADVADAVGAYLQQLNLMTPAESLELLSKSLEREIEGVEKQEALRVSQTVGYLPIALNLVAARVKWGITWVKLETTLKQEVANLKVLYGARQENSLEATFNLSLKALRDYDEQAWKNFIWLGVLPEDVTIAAPMAVTLWDMESQDEADERLELLWNDALLQSDSPIFIGGAEWKGYRLHDLLHDVARSLLIKSPPTGMGLNLLDAHSQLLERYRKKTEKNLWHTLPNDSYIHQNLVWHLEKAGQVEEIHQLLREESQAGNNGWYEVREKLGQTEGYITDISRAWELIEANWTESPLPQVVSLQCRYALITASLNSLAANLPNELLVALVKNNIWTPEQGLSYALQNPYQEQKVYLLTKLVDYLPPDYKEIALQKALATARTIQDESFHAFALAVLVEKLPELLPEALTAARAIQIKEYRASALTVLAEKLPELLPEALTVASSIQIEEYRTDALKALAKKLPAELLPEALTAVRAIQNEEYRASALCALSNKLPELLPEVLTVAKTIQNEYYRTEALRALIDQLPELLPEALMAARAIQDEYYHAYALIGLVDKQPELLTEALTAAKAIQDEEDRADALCALADKLPLQLLPVALTAAKTIQYESYRANTLSALANKLPEVLLEALAAARAIQDEEYCTSALLTVLADKPPELLSKAQVAASLMNDEDHTVNLCALDDKQPPHLLSKSKALAAARAIEDGYSRVNALIALSDMLPKLLPEALTAARAIQDKEDRADALCILTDKLPALLPEALAAAKAIQNENYFVSALRALAFGLSQMPSAELFPLWQDILHQLSLSTRLQLLQGIKALFPAIFVLGGQAARTEIARAIQDVARWWR